MLNGDDQQFLQYQQKEQPYLTLLQWTQKDHDIYRCISRSCLLSRATLTELIRLETNVFRIKLNLLLLANCPNINNKNDWLRWDYVMNERVAQDTSFWFRRPLLILHIQHLMCQTATMVQWFVLASNTMDRGFEPQLDHTTGYQICIPRKARKAKTQEQRLVGSESG